MQAFDDHCHLQVTSGEEPVGRVHSHETAGAVDGPGLRYIVFLQGCPLSCLYCHNPDARPRFDGNQRSVSDVVSDVQRYRHYLRRGGVTISGGEPLGQATFVRALIDRLQAEGFHTAVDTSGCGNERQGRLVFEACDLVLLDIKLMDAVRYEQLTGAPLAVTLKTAKLLAKLERDTWLRYVLVPGLTDDPDDVARLADYAASLGNIRRVDVLPFHNLGAHKWAALGLDYQLAGTPEPTPEQVEAARAVFRARGLDVR